jgi:hypothetical protein
MDMSSSPNSVGASKVARVNRRGFLMGATPAILAAEKARADTDLKPVLAEVDKRHDESVRRIQGFRETAKIARQPAGAVEKTRRARIIGFA